MNIYNITICQCNNKYSLEKLTLYLLKKNIISCVNIINNIESMYIYKKKIKKEKKHILLINNINKNQKLYIKNICSIKDIQIINIKIKHTQK